MINEVTYNRSADFLEGRDDMDELLRYCRRAGRDAAADREVFSGSREGAWVIFLESHAEEDQMELQCNACRKAFTKGWVG